MQLSEETDTAWASILLVQSQANTACSGVSGDGSQKQHVLYQTSFVLCDLDVVPGRLV